MKEIFSHPNLSTVIEGKFNLFAAELNLLWRIIKYDKINLTKTLITRALFFFLKTMDINALFSLTKLNPQEPLLKEIKDYANKKHLDNSKCLEMFVPIHLVYCETLASSLVDILKDKENRKRFLNLVEDSAKKIDSHGEEYFPEYNYSLNGVLQIFGFKSVQMVSFIGYLAFFKEEFFSYYNYKFDGYKSLLDSYSLYEEKLQVYKYFIGLSQVFRYYDDEKKENCEYFVEVNNDFDYKLNDFFEKKIIVKTKEGWIGLKKYINVNECISSHRDTIYNNINLGVNKKENKFTVSIFAKKGHYGSVEFSHNYVKFLASDDASEHGCSCDGEASFNLKNLKEKDFKNMVLALEKHASCDISFLASKEKQDVTSACIYIKENNLSSNLEKIVCLAANFLNKYFDIYDGLSELKNILL